MKNYIDKNIGLRSTLEGSARDVPKLCMNAIYGKTLQNDLAKCDWTLKNELPKIYKLVQKPNFKDIKHVNNDTFLINQLKTSVSYDSPRYIGATILDLSKLQMLSTFYELKDKFNLNLLATDTDSLMLEVFHDGSIEDLFKTIPKMDFSNYPKDHPLFSNEFNSQDGYIKDEFCGLVASEFVGLRPKVYSFMIDGKQKNTAKGIPRSVVKRECNHETYKKVLFENGTTEHTFKTLKSINHQVHTIEMTKKGLNSFDDKRFLMPDGITTKPYE